MTTDPNQMKDAVDAYDKLSDAEKLQFQQQRPSKPSYVGAPSQGVIDYTWRIIIGVFAAVFLFAALAIFASIWVSPATTTKSTDILVTVFSTSVGFLAGVLTPSPVSSKS